MSAPAWRYKHPCTSCGEGYGFCVQFLILSKKCCTDCNHPGRWTKKPWTIGEVVEMWEGKEMPEYVKRTLPFELRENL